MQAASVSSVQSFTAQNGESRIARFPESRASNRQKLRNEKPKNESNRIFYFYCCLAVSDKQNSLRSQKEVGARACLGRGGGAGGREGGERKKDAQVPLLQYPLARDQCINNSPGFFFGCGFFAYSWKLPAYSGAFLLTVDNFSFFDLQLELCLLTVLAFLLTVGAFLLTVGKCV